MNSPTEVKRNKPFLVKTLFLAIAAQTLGAGYCYAGPTGGVVVDGAGSIESSGTTTQIDQDTHRLSLEWDTFNVGADERVDFVQPSSQSVALNRILDNNGSDILGQINANGRVILMNPNGIYFGEGATVNVGGLVASGLNIDSDDFMNGDLAFRAIEGSAGVVVNSGIINAATGGSVALIGKNVANHGLISAHLGHIALASGSEAVVTFDDQGLIGVRIDKETLAGEVDGDYAVNNSGTLEAKGGKILLNASVSADLFSQAVNRGDMSGDTEAVVHDDSSFTLGSGNNVVNTGVVDVSTGTGATDAGGHVVVAGDEVAHEGTILANAEGDNQAGDVYLEASSRVNLGASSRVEASGSDHTSGKVSLEAPSLMAETGAMVHAGGDTRLTAQDRIRAPEMDTHQLYIQSAGEVDQAGFANVSGDTHLLLANGADVDLTHADNDFNTLSMDARYGNDVLIHDRNDILLGDVEIVDGKVGIQSLGEGSAMAQTDESRIQLFGSELHLEADNVVLGAGGSTTHVHHSFLDILFDTYVNTNESITLVDDFAPMPTGARIANTSSSFFDGSLEVTGDKEIDLNATVDSPEYDFATSTIANMRGTDARLSGAMETYQTGPIRLSNALTWRSYRTTLDHPENDIAYLQGGSGGPFSSLNYVDKNDIIIGDLGSTSEIAVNITSVGKGATISQKPDTSLSTSHITLDADNVILGADGRSEVLASYTLHIAFSDNLVINGRYSVFNSYGARMSITGDDSNNNALFGEHATVNPFPSGDGFDDRFKINLGGGNDQVTFTNGLFSPHGADFNIDMGSGNDRLEFEDDVVAKGNGKINFNMGDGNDLLAFVSDFTVEGWWEVGFHMGDGNDSLAFMGDFLADAKSSSTGNKIDIDMGRGNDWAAFVNGLTVNGILQEGSELNLGSGNDELLFIGNIDVPIRLGAGKDLVMAEGANAAFDIVDYDAEEDELVAITP